MTQIEPALRLPLTEAQARMYVRKLAEYNGLERFTADYLRAAMGWSVITLPCGCRMVRCWYSQRWELEC